MFYGSASFESKLSDVGFARNLLRILTNDNFFALHNASTIHKVATKYPNPDTSLTFFLKFTAANFTFLSISKTKLLKAIFLFHVESVAGLNDLQPQHLKNMMFFIDGEVNKKLLSALPFFCNTCSVMCNLRG